MSSIHPISSEIVECQVCCSEVRSFLICGNCKWVSCYDCIQTYILSVPTARCMNCSSTFSEHFLRMYLPHSWIERKYKPYLKEQLFEIEKSQFSTTVELANVYKKMQIGRKLCETPDSEFDINQAKKFIADVESSNALAGPAVTLWNRHFSKSKKYSISDYKNKILLLYHQLNNAFILATDNFNPFNEEDEKRSRVSLKKYIRPCCQPDCKGFFDETNPDGWKCALCEVIICQECRVVKLKNSSSHVCDPQILKSVKLIQDESKACPSCSEPISKTFGCDHMFCTVCKANFSWKTGQLIPVSRQTNPLYRQYLENLRKKSINSNCATTLDEFSRFLHNHVGKVNMYYDVEKKKISNIDKLVKLIYDLDSLQTDPNPTNIVNRVKFMNNEQDEKTFKSKVLATYKRSEYSNELTNLKNVTQQCLIDYYMLLESWIKSEKEKFSSKPKSNSTTKTKKIKSSEIFVDLTQWEHYGKHNEIINFFNTQSIELAKLYGYTATLIISNEKGLKCKRKNIKKVAENFHLN